MHPLCSAQVQLDAVHARCDFCFGLLTYHVGVCSGFVLPITDVIRHLFSNATFARFAGVRTQAMLESPFYARLDAAHDGAISALSVADADAPAVGLAQPADDGEVPASSEHDTEQLQPVEDADPSDEVMTGGGDTLALLFGLFVDGVQLHANGRSTTTVVSLKCLDLPGFLVGTKVASYNLAFISGPKEPTCMTDFVHIILHQFKEYEPKVTREGVPTRCRFALLSV